MHKYRFLSSWIIGGASLLLVVGIGVALLQGSRAASPYVAAEPETGILNGASTVSDITASGGSAVRFGTGGSGPLSSKVSGIYWPNWQGTPPLRDIPAIDNLIYAAFAFGDGGQGGGVVWKSDDGSGVPAATFKSDMAVARGKGQKIVLSVGGQNDLGIHLTNATQVTQMVTSLNQIVTDYGFDGIDWDLENSANFTVASLVSASTQLKQRWGPDFIIAAAPAPSSIPYKQMAQQLGGNLDFFSMQFYDYQATDAERISGIKSRINEMINTYGVPAGKLGIGCKNYDAANASFVSSPAVYRQAFDELEVLHPTLRGAFVWEAILESTHGYPFTNLVGKDVRNLP